MIINISMIIITVGTIVDAGTSNEDTESVSTMRSLFLATRAGLDSGEPCDLRIIPGMSPHPAKADVIA